MALYQIETADGETYELEAADEQQLQQAVAQLSGNLATAKPVTRQESSLWDDMKRGAGLTARSIVQGVTDLPSLPGDLATSLVNLGNQYFGKPYQVTRDGQKVWIDPRQQRLPTVSEQRDATLTELGFPEPATPLERVVSTAGRASTGAGAFAGAASRLPGPLAQSMASRPGLQMVSGASSGASAGIAREMGAGPVGQFVAGLAGGVLPALIAPRAPNPQRSFEENMRMLQRAGSRADASAEATPGVASAELNVRAAPEVAARGGGSSFGHVGDDPSAGLSVPIQRIADRGREMGFRLTPGQATGAKALQQLEAKLESQPMTSGPFNALKEHNARLVARAAAEAIGENSTTLDDAVLARAEARIGRVFEDAADDVQRTIEPREFIRTYSAIKDDVHGLVKGFDKHELVEDVTALAVSGKATGKQLQSLTSKLGKAAYKQMSTPSGDRDLGSALYGLKDYVDDLLLQGMSGERAARFNQARGQYRNLMLLLSRSGIVNPATGDVAGRSLATTLQMKDRRGYTFGENDSPMYEAARFSQAFQPIVGNSGTATRAPLQGPIDLLARAPLNIAGRMYTSSPGVRLATRAQAAASTLADYPTNLRQPLDVPDVPYGALFGPAISQEERRKRLTKELINAEEEE